MPDSVVIDIVRERLTHDDCKHGFVLDGFPRTVHQAEALAEFATIDAVIDIEVDDEVLTRRLSGRRVCPECGASFHISRLNGSNVCDKCGAELIHRDDDRPETVLSRLKVYHEQTAPLIDYYKAESLLRKAKGSASVDEFFDSIMELLGEAK